MKHIKDKLERIRGIKAQVIPGVEFFFSQIRKLSLGICQESFYRYNEFLKSCGEHENKIHDALKTIRILSYITSPSLPYRTSTGVFEELVHIYGITLLSGKIPEHELVKLLSLYDIHKFSEAPREMGPDDLLKVFNLIIQEYGKK